MLFLQCVDGIKPTLSELEKFEEQPEGMDIECKLSCQSFFFFILHAATSRCRLQLKSSWGSWCFFKL